MGFASRAVHVLGGVEGASVLLVFQLFVGLGIGIGIVASNLLQKAELIGLELDFLVRLLGLNCVLGGCRIVNYGFLNCFRCLLFDILGQSDEFLSFFEARPDELVLIDCKGTAGWEIPWLLRLSSAALVRLVNRLHGYFIN